ncbi:MAG: C40 family peptidase [Bacteroidales bacterium]|jgi:cell wall-associated NlpC family hydrolase|nr:C40 family peptidase [Bacteroidales bacterium]HOL98230.1 C40 family peptidase [Bacteroidales bacterium]HOM36583.1 C40 family peptidase [Bacteroidales bacterium]HPD24009.1 C40 family peptidase [Bacteroidales bacterium]HRT00040.1 C40 family peptidase [Bacteroidales bacterium]
MKTVICENSYIPVRAGLSHKSEMITQVLFGELFEIINKSDNWIKIRTLHDDYEGWIDNSQYNIETDKAPEYDISELLTCHQEITLKTADNHLLKIPAGAKIPKNAIQKKVFYINSNKFEIVSEFSEIKSELDREKISEIALKMLNAPYLWGGRSSFGFDCSGFTQFLYSLVNIKIPRDASAQFELGNPLNFIIEAKPGDLAFFENDEGFITHTGILIDQGKIIHASGKIRIDFLDHQGIFNKNIRKYTHKLKVIKSIL